MAMKVERISAVTFRVSNMKVSVQFYRDVLGIEELYGGEGAFFSSLRAGEAESAILNLEQGEPVNGWGRLIFRMWTRSGDASTIWDSGPKTRGMLLGANGISTCSTRMGMSCRLRGRYARRMSIENRSKPLSKTSTRKSLRRAYRRLGTAHSSEITFSSHLSLCFLSFRPLPS